MLTLMFAIEVLEWLDQLPDEEVALRAVAVRRLLREMDAVLDAFSDQPEIHRMLHDRIRRP